MYLPSSELQQYNGQWTCPYCMMDMKDEERRRTERADKREEKRKQDEWAEKARQTEQCERCGKPLFTVYYLNGKKLCSVCAQETKGGGGGVGPERPPLFPYKIREEKDSKPRGLSGFIAVLEAKIGEILAWIGLIETKEKKIARIQRENFDRYGGVLKEDKKNAFAIARLMREERLSGVKKTSKIAKEKKPADAKKPEKPKKQQ